LLTPESLAGSLSIKLNEGTRAVLRPDHVPGFSPPEPKVWKDLEISDWFAVLLTCKIARRLECVR